MTKLFSAPHGQVDDFLRKLTAAGFNAEHMLELSKDQARMNAWVAMLGSQEETLVTSEDILIQDVFAADEMVSNLFKRNDVFKLTDLSEWSRSEIANLPGIGIKRIVMIEKALFEHNVTLSEHKPDDEDRVVLTRGGKFYRAVRRDHLDDVPIAYVMKLPEGRFYLKKPGSRFKRIGMLRRMSIAELCEHYATSTANTIHDWIAKNVW